MGAGINKGYMPASFDQAVADEFVGVFLKNWIDKEFGDIKKCKMGKLRNMLKEQMDPPVWAFCLLLFSFATSRLVSWS